jgi:negative regulator of flagellin synthesis FlgM
MPDPIRGANPIDVVGGASAAQSGTSPAARPTAQSSVASVPVDTADLSRAEALLTTISQASAAVPSIDRTRVSELQQALNSGTYQANPQLIAEKIMEIESLLSSSRGGG